MGIGKLLFNTLLGPALGCFDMLWMDSLDFYTSSAIFPYESNGGVTIGSSFARNGLNGAQFSAANYVRKNLQTNISSIVAGRAVKFTTMPGGGPAANGILAFEDALLSQISLAIDPTGKAVLANNGGTILASTSGLVCPINQWHYFELEVVNFATSTGVTNVYVDGSQVLSFTGTNITSSNTFCNQVTYGRRTNAGGVGVDNGDDFYCLSRVGASPWNAPLGDCVVVAEMPNASGSFTQFTPNPGTNANWFNVKEIPADGITTYNASSATGNRDSFNFPTFPPAALTSFGNIIAVMMLEYGQADTAGACAVQLSARQAGVDAFGSNINLGVGFTYGAPTFFQKDVNGNLWIPSNLNATEFGYKRTL